MSAPFTRDLSITYAGITIGGSDEYYLLFDRHRVFGSYEEIGFEGRVLVRADSAATFATKCAALETAFQTANGALVITQESQALRTISHSSNTGMLGRPSFSKVGGPEDTGRSRLYNVSVRAQRPADLSGKSGLRIAEFTLETAFFGVRTYRVAGTYTAISGTAAKAQYESAIGTALTSLEAALNGTWERMDKSVRWDDENKIAHFTQTGFETGLRDGHYQIFTTQTGIRSYRVEGSYTAVGATGAQATYASSIGALLTAFESGLGSSWLRGAYTTQRDQADKLVRFSYEGIEFSLRDAVYKVDASDSGVRRYVVSGKYCAETGADTASAIYASSIAGLLTTFEGGLGGTWERTNNRYVKDQTDTTVDFEWTGVEVICNQAAGVLDNSALKNAQMVVVRKSVAPGDYAGAKRPVDLVVTYNASVDKSVTTDLKGLWDGTVKPYLIAHARSLADGSQVALIESDPGISQSANTLNASMLLQVFDANIFSHVVETEDYTITGVELVGVWSIDPDAYAEFNGSRVRIRTIAEDIGRIGAAAAPQVAGGGAAGGKIDAAGAGPGLASERSIGDGSSASLPGVGPSEPGYRLLHTTQRSRPERRGLDDLGLDVVFERFVHVLQYRNPVKGGTASGGGASDGRIASGVT